MPDGIKIGHYDKGAFSFRKDVTASATSTRGVSYEAALAATKRTAGADLIVARQSGGTYTYDVMDVAIKKTPVAGAGKFLTLVDNVPGTVGGTEAILVDEQHTAKVLVPANAAGDAGIGRRAISHAKARDLDGAIALTAGITTSGIRSTLTQTFTQLKATRQELEQREATLRSQLRSAEQALSTKRAPYDTALTQATTAHQQTTAKHRDIVFDKSEDLREARNPGVHQAENDVRRQQGEVSSARQGLDRANGALQDARSTLNRADQLQAELDNIPYKIRTIDRKLDDYAIAQRDYESAMRRYESDMRRYEADMREYQNQPSGSQYQNQPSGSQYQNQPSGGQYQNQPSGGQYQNQPSGGQYQNQPSNSQYQNQPSNSQYQNRPAPTRPTKPTLREPSSWSWGDTEYGLRSERRNLESRQYNLRGEVTRVRNDGYRQQDAANEQVRQAQGNLSRAENRLDAAQEHLRNLPAGNPATIKTAERNLAAAQKAQTDALAAAQAKVDAARKALDTNTQQERAKVQQLQGDLQAAPNAFQNAIDEAARRAGL
jgi:predicted  nucleic acid-binding Zn-ribbon protein